MFISVVGSSFLSPAISLIGSPGTTFCMMNRISVTPRKTGMNCRIRLAMYLSHSDTLLIWFLQRAAAQLIDPCRGEITSIGQTLHQAKVQRVSYRGLTQQTGHRHIDGALFNITCAGFYPCVSCN